MEHKTLTPEMAAQAARADARRKEAAVLGRKACHASGCEGSELLCGLRFAHMGPHQDLASMFQWPRTKDETDAPMPEVEGFDFDLYQAAKAPEGFDNAARVRDYRRHLLRAQRRRRKQP
jgi:hypothetical protein